MLTRQQAGHALAHRAGFDERGQVFLAAQVLAQSDEFHLGRDGPLARIVHLGDVAPGARPARAALQFEAQGGK